MDARKPQRAGLAYRSRKKGWPVRNLFLGDVRRKTGYAPVDFYLRMKVQHACLLLDTTPMRIDEVAAAIGFEDPFYFSRLFRRIMTKSPRAYRAAAKRQSGCRGRLPEQPYGCGGMTDFPRTCNCVRSSGFILKLSIPKPGRCDVESFAMDTPLPSSFLRMLFCSEPGSADYAEAFARLLLPGL